MEVNLWENFCGIKGGQLQVGPWIESSFKRGSYFSIDFVYKTRGEILKHVFKGAIIRISK